MKTMRHIPTQPKHFVPHLVSIVMSILLVSLVPTAAVAAPPAALATCPGIRAAYSILGTQCETAYAIIDHQPTSAGERRASFGARKTVMQIFRKALLCNGLYGASKSAQQRFQSGEEGHLTAIDLLHTAMVNAGDPNIPAAFTVADLNLVKINKAQCK
jgi:hypothetical protein